ncbi:MAG: hypothetical protein OXE99_10800 [Cellvibrionales bacterium]|nr:hypothetical protein [Cellvibrionales bacterium]
MGQDAAIEAARQIKLGVMQGRDLVAERQVEQEQVIPKKLVNDNTNIVAFLNAFIRWRKESFPDKQGTNHYYEKQVNNHLLPRWGLFSIDAITQWTWQEYIRGFGY